MGTGSFAALTSVLLLAVAASAAAQREPPIPPPPAPAALSVPNPLTAMTPGPRDLYRSPDGSDRFQHLSPYPAPPPVFFFPGPYLPGPYLPGPYLPGSYLPGPYYPGPYYPYGPLGGYHTQSGYRHPYEIAVPRGGLVLESLPGNAQIYVDGFYVGLVQDSAMRGRLLELPAGAHRVEARAPGYEVLTFSVLVQPNEIVRFRGEMQAIPTPATLRAAQPAARKAFYVIPNCYAGDTPPRGALPRGCSVKNLQTRK